MGTLKDELSKVVNAWEPPKAEEQSFATRMRTWLRANPSSTTKEVHAGMGEDVPLSQVSARIAQGKAAGYIEASDSRPARYWVTDKAVQPRGGVRKAAKAPKAVLPKKETVIKAVKQAWPSDADVAAWPLEKAQALYLQLHKYFGGPPWTKT